MTLVQKHTSPYNTAAIDLIFHEHCRQFFTTKRRERLGRSTSEVTSTTSGIGGGLKTAGAGFWCDDTKYSSSSLSDSESQMNSTATCSTWRWMGSVRLYLAHDKPYNENKQQYHTGSVAARVNKDRAFLRTPGRRCQACYWCIIEDSKKKQHHQWHIEHKDTKSCRETRGTNTRNGQVQTEHPWTL